MTPFASAGAEEIGNFVIDLALAGRDCRAKLKGVETIVRGQLTPSQEKVTLPSLPN